MNLSLLDPFAVAKEFPESLTNVLGLPAHPGCIKYNKNGDYLACGLHDGSIAIIDYDTYAVIKTLQYGHSRAITSVDWSSCGRYILSSSRDWKINLWDLSTCTVIRTMNFGSAIWNCQLHPKTHLQFVASIYEEPAVFVDWTEKSNVMVNVLGTAVEVKDPEEMEVDEVPSKMQKNFTLVTLFHPDGGHIFTGTSKGFLNVICTETRKVQKSYKLTNSNIKNIIISQKSNKLAVNSSDRIIRQMTLPDFVLLENPEDWDTYFEVEQRYQDVVNRLQWNSIAFNFNGDYLIASALGSSHEIYMWETTMGSLVKTLEGPKEELYDVDWNYKKCCIAATGLDSSTIYIWSISIPPKWSALAPDFVEVEENVDYEEKEDEFDIVDEDEVKENDSSDNSEDKIDIISKDIVDARGLLVADSFVVPVNLDINLYTDNVGYNGSYNSRTFDEDQE